MNDILIFRFSASEGPGYIAQYLARRGLPHRLVRVDSGDAVPKSIAGIPGLVLMGGPMSANDPLPWVAPVAALVRAAVAADVPVLGHCLGGQLISKALGGSITNNPAREVGWHTVQRIDGPAADDWLDGLPREFEAFHWHGETFSIPPGAARILSSAHCANQAFVAGRTLGFQCHVEMTAEMVRAWVREGADYIAQPSASVQTAAQMLSDIDARIARQQSVADRFYDRWAQGLTRVA
jgi:GMP synthase-like glutamine amidotransferase